MFPAWPFLMSTFLPGLLVPDACPIAVPPPAWDLAGLSSNKTLNCHELDSLECVIGQLCTMIATSLSLTGENMVRVRVLSLVVTLALALLVAPPPASAAVSAATAAAAATAAESKLGSPYGWGDEGPDSFDASGLVYWAYQQAGLTVARTAEQQRQATRSIPYSRIKRGDLIFYNTTGGTAADHVAIFQGVTPDGAYMVEARSFGTSVRTTPVRRSDVIEYGTYR